MRATEDGASKRLLNQSDPRIQYSMLRQGIV